MPVQLFPGRGEPPDWNGLQTLALQRLPPHAYLIQFPDQYSCQAALSNNRRYLSPSVIMLNGEWDFKLYDSILDMPENILSFRSGFAPVNVPGAWQLQGFAVPQVAGPAYPFPVCPPYVPAQAPVGVYRRRLTLPLAWSKVRKRLVLTGVRAALHIFVNSKPAGYSQGSGLPAEFDITPYLHDGDNELFIIVYSWCDGSYLEYCDDFLLHGILRDVYLEAIPTLSIFDVSHTMQPVDGVASGRWQLRVQVQLLSYRISMETPNLRISLWQDDELITQTESLVPLKPADKERFDGPVQAMGQVTTVLHCTDIVPWHAEAPHLYDLFVTMLDRSGQEIGCVQQSVGFRILSWQQGVLCLNEKPLKLIAVQRREWQADFGPTVPIETMLADIRQMKLNHINTVRLIGDPPDPIWLELCNIFGLYVIADQAVTLAGVPSQGQAIAHIPDPFHLGQNLVASPSPGTGETDWSDSLRDRIERLVLRDRSQPCVIAWSLGRSVTDGSLAEFDMILQPADYQTMIRRIRSLDQTRPIYQARICSYQGSIPGLDPASDKKPARTGQQNRPVPAPKAAAATRPVASPVAQATVPAGSAQFDPAGRSSGVQAASRVQPDIHDIHVLPYPYELAERADRVDGPDRAADWLTAPAGGGPVFLSDWRSVVSIGQADPGPVLGQIYRQPWLAGACFGEWSDLALYVGLSATKAATPVLSDAGQPAGWPSRALGLVDVDRHANSQLLVLRQAARPLDIQAINAALGHFRIINRQQFLSLEPFHLRWELLRDGNICLSSEQPLPAVAPGSQETMMLNFGPLDLSGGHDYTICLTVVQNQPTLWAPAATELFFQEFNIGTQRPLALPLEASLAGVNHPGRSRLRLERDRHLLVLSGHRFWMLFNQITGTLDSWRAGDREILTSRNYLTRPVIDLPDNGLLRSEWSAEPANPADSPGPRVCLWRQIEAGDLASIKAWQLAGYDRLQRQVRSCESDCDGHAAVIEFRADLAAPGQIAVLRSVTRYEINAAGHLTLFVSLAAIRSHLPLVPRLGLRFDLKPTYEKISWFGRGPGPSWPGQQITARTGLFQRYYSELDADWPERGIHAARADTRWLTLQDSTGFGLLIHSDNLFSFSVHDSLLEDRLAGTVPDTGPLQRRLLKEVIVEPRRGDSIAPLSEMPAVMKTSLTLIPVFGDLNGGDRKHN